MTSEELPEIPETSREELERQVAVFEAKIARRKLEKAAKLAEREQQTKELAAKIDADAIRDGDPTPAEELIRRLMEGFRITPRPPDEIRAYRMEKEVLPRLRSAGWEKRFIKEIADIGEPKQIAALKVLDRYLVGCGAIVALIGIRGTGKTTLGAQLSIRRMFEWLDWYALDARERKGAHPRGPAVYRKLSDLVARFKVIYSDMGGINMEDLTAERDQLCEQPTLVIDEIHECDDMRLGSRVLTDICDRCYAKENDVLLISNQTEKDFRETTNPSILSRISEHGGIIPCTWQSWRETPKPSPGVPKLGDGGMKAASKRLDR